MAPVLGFALGVLLAGQSLASPKVVSMPIRHTRRNNTGIDHQKRQFAVSLENLLAGHQYFAAASVGSNAQSIELVIDTGSSDTWMFSSGSCRRNKAGPCIGGEFDTSQSDTYQTVPSLGLFKNQYGDGSKVQGPYFRDSFAVGGKTVKGLTMGLASQSKGIIRSGIMGIGFASNEGRVAFGRPSYPNLPDLLVSQGLINSKSFSLYLDNLADATGSVLFGGYDPSKYEGNMIMLPIQKDPIVGVKDAYFVSLVAIALSGQGKTFLLGSNHDPYPIAVLLDSGTENINIPLEMFQPFIQAFRLKPLQQGSAGLFAPYQVDCDLAQRTDHDSVVFAFGSNKGPLIRVPIEELVVPFYDPYTGKQVHLYGQPFCRFGIAAATPGSPIIFGQTFLRSAYALYDLDNKAVGLAQAKYDATSSNVKEYTGPGNGIVVDTHEPAAVPVNYQGHSYVYNFPKTPVVSVIHTDFPAPNDPSTPPASVTPTPAAATGTSNDNGDTSGSSSGSSSGGNNAAGTVSVFSTSASLIVAASMLASLLSAVYIL